MTALVASVRLVAADIKVAHSVFALPFAALAAVMARPSAPGSVVTQGRFAAQIALVVGCMIAARTWAMLFNRIADASIDARNPRTARRAVASGALSRAAAWAFALGSAGVFVALTSGFGMLTGNWWPAVLALPVLAWIALYSLTKRFTWLCHLFLGGALAASPVAAAVALDPQAVGLSASWPLAIVHPAVPAIWALAAMVLLWVAGFDVIYALQDTAVDRREGLFSIPSRLGVPAAIWIARSFHVAAFGALVLAWKLDPRLNVAFLAAIALVGALLVIEHWIVAKQGERGIDMAFFTVNGVVSVILGLSGILDVAWG